MGNILSFNQNLELISEVGASGASSVEFTDFPTHFSKLILIVEQLTPGTDIVRFQLRTSSDGGVTYDTGASDYSWSGEYSDVPSTQSYQGDAADSEIQIVNDLGTATIETYDGEIHIFNTSEAALYTTLYSNFTGHNRNSAYNRVEGFGRRIEADIVDGLQLTMSSGTISGTFKLYGV